MDAGYGAATAKTSDGHELKTHVMHKRRRQNIVAAFLCLFVPWGIFCVVLACRSFSIRYKNPDGSGGIVAFCFLVVLMTLGLAYNQYKKRTQSGYEPVWYIFLFITCLMAWFMGMIAGESAWNNGMGAYMGRNHLNEYFYVDPARMRGQQMMDAGLVHFTNTTHLDTSLSMGFSNNGIYCVAPITSVNAPLASYDFWAVGKDCCAGSANNFKCGAWDNPLANEGMRLLKDEQRPFFRLAVQQAEAIHGIKAEHPLFFTWVADANGLQNASYMAAWSYYFMGMCGYFFLQSFLVVIYSWIGVSKLRAY